MLQISAMCRAWLHPSRPGGLLQRYLRRAVPRYHRSDRQRQLQPSGNLQCHRGMQLDLNNYE